MRATHNKWGLVNCQKSEFEFGFESGGISALGSGEYLSWMVGLPG